MERVVMRKVSVISLAALCFHLAACSGFLPAWSDEGRIVSPGEIAQYRGAGSMSTLWYYGSDAEYHYFSHLVKTATRYRVRREELLITDEFPYKSRKAEFVGNKPYWRDAQGSP